MTKPSDSSPDEALGATTSSDAIPSRGTRWMLQIVGAGVLLVGWLAVSLRDIGQIAFPKISRRPGQNVFKPKVHQT